MFMEEQPFKIYVMNDHRTKLPPEMQKADVLEFTFNDLVFDHSYIEADELYVVLAVGDEQVIKQVTIKDLIAIFDSEGKIVMYKPFNEVEDEYSIHFNHEKGLMRSLMDDEVMVIKK